MGCEEPVTAPSKPVVVKKRIAETVSTAKPEKKQTQTSGEEKKEAPVSSTAPTRSPKVSVSKKEAADSTSSTEFTSRKEAPKEKKPSSVIPTAPADKAVETNVSLTEKIADASPRYDPKGKTDPFAPLFVDKPQMAVSNTKKAIRRRPLTPLEKIDLSQLTLVAVIRAPSGNRAMVEDATGKGYIVTKGAYVGINGGQVARVEKDRVFIAEKLVDIFGKITVSQKELKLQKPPGEE